MDQHERNRRRFNKRLALHSRPSAGRDTPRLAEVAAIDEARVVAREYRRRCWVRATHLQGDGSKAFRARLEADARRAGGIDAWVRQSLDLARYCLRDAATFRAMRRVRLP